MSSWYIVGGFGLIALAIGVWGLVAGRQYKRRLMTVDRFTPGEIAALHQAAVAAAGEGAFREEVQVAGEVAAGPDGLLTAELSETPCVWHHRIVDRKFQRMTTNKDGHRVAHDLSERVTNDRTPNPFLLTAEEGSVLVVPSTDEGHFPQDATRVVNRFEKSEGAVEGEDGTTLGYQYQEWVLRPGDRIFVQGEASDRNGRLEVGKPEGRAPLIITTKTTDDLREHADGRIRFSTWFAVGGGAVVLASLAGVLVGS